MDFADAGGGVMGEIYVRAGEGVRDAGRGDALVRVSDGVKRVGRTRMYVVSFGF